MIYSVKIAKILMGYCAYSKRHGTNSSETSNIIDIGFEKPRQHIWLRFGKSFGKRGVTFKFYADSNTTTAAGIPCYTLSVTASSSTFKIRFCQ
jgi:hypothetical protein